MYMTTKDATVATLADGRVFPIYDGEVLSWSPGMYHTHAEAEIGYPRMHAVIRALMEHRPEHLERERREMLKGSFDRMFGHNAKVVLEVIEEELGKC
jgi:hypothetical protein